METRLHPFLCSYDFGCNLRRFFKLMDTFRDIDLSEMDFFRFLFSKY